ncbi:MAG: hypothetical protein HWE26_14300 [Alteromonadaceae bacterium]|nr:hypothetical protein [Alteromonadaceae bacterium]
MKRFNVPLIVTSALLFVVQNSNACQLHASGFGAFAPYHNTRMPGTLQNLADSFPSINLASRALVTVGSNNSQQVKITVPLSYTNVSLTVESSDNITVLSRRELILSSVSEQYDLGFTTDVPGTHEITVYLNAMNEGSAFTTQQTLIVEAG